MIGKFEVDEQKEDKQIIKELAAKVNEVIDALPTRVPLASRPPARVIAPLQLTEYLVTMTTRMVNGPYATLAQVAEGDDLATAVGAALTQLQNALQSYKDSLVTKTPE